MSDDIQIEKRRPGRPPNAVRQQTQYEDEPVNEVRAPRAKAIIRTALNRFDIDESRQPAHMTYGWRVFSVYGKEETQELINDEINEWTPVPQERHPEFYGSRVQKGKPIIIGGLMLCEKARELTDQARIMDSEKAQDQVSTHVKRLGLDSQRQVGGKNTQLKRQTVQLTQD